MLQSEQLDTRLILAANDDIAAGLLIQRLPVEGEGNLEGERRAAAGPPQGEAASPSAGWPRQGSGGSHVDEDQIGLNEAFNRIAHLAATLTRDELLTLDADTILRRLFWEEDVRRFEPLAPRFACTCSRERVRGMLRSLGREEVDGILAERGDVEIGCEFCGTQYRFDAIDVADVFTPLAQRVPGSGSVN